MLQSAPPRGPRGVSSSVRGRGRGGIQKHRTDGPIRVDKDGDLVMGASITGDKRRSTTSRTDRSTTKARPTRGVGPIRGLAGQRGQAAILRGLEGRQANLRETVVIDGLDTSKAANNPDGGMEALLAFIERKASNKEGGLEAPMSKNKRYKRGPKVYLTASAKDIVEILKVDGFTFAGSVLSIQPTKKLADRRAPPERTPEEAARTEDTKAKFKAALYERYDPQQKLLNLAALAEDAGFKAIFDGTADTSKVFPALMTVCDGLFKTLAEKRDAIVSVVLSNNGLGSVKDVFSLCDSLPDLKNLDLSRNRLADLKALNPWRYKFRDLENLVLNENPIVKQLPTLKDDIMKWYPKLSMLSNVQVRTPEELAASAAAAEKAKFPLDVTGPLFTDVSQVGETFIVQFLSLYDKDRSALIAQYYDTQSSFSLAVDTNAARNRYDQKPIPPWVKYMPHSRNLQKITNLGTRERRSFNGAQAIKDLWALLPATQHPDIKAQNDKYLIECQIVHGLPDPTGQNAHGVNGLMITIHGEFEEEKTVDIEHPTRSFSRAFILGPGMPGFQPIRVINDMLTLRAWAPLLINNTSASTPPPQHIQMAMPQQPQMVAPMQMSEQQQKEAMMAQLMEKTGLQPQYANLCLDQTGWNLDAAYGAFTANRANLPADAFQPGVPL